MTHPLPLPLSTSHVLLVDGWDGDDDLPLSLPVEVIPAPLSPEGEARLAARGQMIGAYGECESCGVTLSTPEPVALVYGATDAPGIPEASHLSCVVLSDHRGLIPRYVVEGWDQGTDRARHLSPSPYGPGAEGHALAW